MNLFKKAWPYIKVYLLGALLVWMVIVMIMGVSADIGTANKNALAKSDDLQLACTLIYGPIIALIWPAWSLLLRRFGIPTPGDAVRWLILISDNEAIKKHIDETVQDRMYKVYPESKNK
jgi:hypothetical protein